MLKNFRISLLLVLCLLFSIVSMAVPAISNADVIQAPEQLLPSMSAPASNLDFIDLSPCPFDEKAMFVSLQGIVNKTQPRLYVWYPSGGNGQNEGKYTWPDSLNLNYTEQPDYFSMLVKYKSEVKGLVIYDPNQVHTLNLATAIAGLEDGIVVSPGLATRLQASPYNYTVLEDLRGRFSTVEDVYNYAYTNVWPQLTHQFIIGLDPDPNSIWGAPGFSGFLRDYAIAAKAMCIYLNPDIASQDTILRKFLNDMPKGKGIYLGWWTQEQAGVGRASQYSIATVPADRCLNLTVLSGMGRSVSAPAIPEKPTLQNKIYIMPVISDGDNLQYLQHHMKYTWDNIGRGQVALSWTVPPTAYDLAPKMLNYFWQSATSKDCLIAGPSGLGYTYPNQWNSSSDFSTFAQHSADYMNAAGLRAITIWGDTDAYTRTLFQKNLSLLGVTTQGSRGDKKFIDGTYPVYDFMTSYTSSLNDVKNKINAVTSSWDGKSPRFAGFQYIGWDVNTDLVSYLKGLDPTKYEIVRADHFFQLMRDWQSNPVTIAAGIYKITSKSSGYVLDVKDNSIANSAKIIQWEWLGGNNQKWNIISVAGGAYKIINVNSGKALVVDGASQKAGTGIIQWDYNGSHNDEWKFYDMGDGYYKLLNVNSGLVLDVPGNSAAMGTQLTQWNDNNDGSNQIFKLELQ